MGRLHELAARGHSEALKRCLNSKERQDIDNMNLQGNLPIHEAVIHNRFDAVCELLDADSPMDVLNSGFDGERTPLMLAAENGSSILLRCLLDAGANPDIQTSTKETALSLCIARNETECARLLLEFGASAHLGSTHPALMAVYQKNAALLETMLQQGMDTRLPSGESLPLLEKAQEQSSAEVLEVLRQFGIA